MEDKTIILGAGIAGLGAAFSLKQKGKVAVVLEKEEMYGGLCGNFTVNGFRFDRFVHLSFTQNENVNRIFTEGCQEIYRHTPNPFNLYHGLWIKHPAQNNLYPLSTEEKTKIIADFRTRPILSNITGISDYEQWLRLQYGNYFAECFPMIYTKKYWMCEAKDLETQWVGNRLYQPSLEEVMQGCETPDTPVTYYAKEMRYPKRGGYKAFLSAMVKEIDIRYNAEVVSISPDERTIKTYNGDMYLYNRLISSLPLPEVLKMLKDVPECVRMAGKKLCCTCGYLVSVGLKTKNIPPYLWWYIYDDDILPARVYSPFLKSPDNAPDGCSSLQMEIYCEKDKYTEDEIIARSVVKLVKLGILNEAEILFTDVRFEEYANVIFDHHIYENRQIVRDYLKSVGIETIGRFGEWDYLWSDQSLLSGLSVE